MPPLLRIDTIIDKMVNMGKGEGGVDMLTIMMMVLTVVTMAMMKVVVGEWV